MKVYCDTTNLYDWKHSGMTTSKGLGMLAHAYNPSTQEAEARE
jgi:hypothetical protein